MQGFLPIPALEAPSDGWAFVFSAPKGRPGWAALTGGSLTGFVAGIVAFGSSGGGLTQDATLSYSGGVLSATNLKSTSLTSGRVTFATTGGQLTDSAGLLFNGTTTLTVGSGSGDALAVLAGGAGQNRFLRVYTGNGSTTANLRWDVGANGVAESGSNAGSPFQINAYGDTGGYIDTPFQIVRAAAGGITMGRQVAITNTTASSSSSTGALVVGNGSSGGLGIGGDLNVGATITAGGTVRVNRSNSFDVTFASYYVGGNFSYYFTADGTMNWGPGTAGVDTTLTRIGVGSLQVGGAFSSTGSIKSTSATGGIGYTTGAGGTVTQATSKSTGVTLNTACGQITMNAAALAAGAKVSFTLTNSAIAATDMVDCCVASGGTANAYRANVTAVAAGSCSITVENITAGSLSEAPVITFAILKAVTS